jgi:ketosteroid isomerase-like protein
VESGNAELVRTGFEAFLRGDFEALEQVMDPDVQWLWYEPGNWDCHDRNKVLTTLRDRQQEGVVTALNAVVATGERVFVEVTGPRLEQWGLPEGQACMVVTVKDGLIVRMQDYPSRAAALAGAGLPVEADDGVVLRFTEAIRTGEAATLAQLLRKHPGLVTTGGSRTWLHVVTDWPGHVPEAAAKIRALVAAGADVNARYAGPQHRETPLHWAASSDDIEALDALLDAGADIEADGGVIGGGTPIADAVAFGRWRAARRLLERGARTSLWQAAALGLVDRVEAELSHSPPVRATSTMRSGARRTAVSARPPSCCSSAARTRPGSATTS